MLHRPGLIVAMLSLVGLAGCEAQTPTSADTAGAARDIPHGLVQVDSPHAVSDTMDRLEAAVKERGFRVFARIDHAAGAASVDMTLRPTQLLIFGNPQGGTPLMQNAQTMGIDLPLKALVYEDAQGQVRVAFNDPAFLADRHDMANAAQIAERMGGLLNALGKAATGS